MVECDGRSQTVRQSDEWGASAQAARWRINQRRKVRIYGVSGRRSREVSWWPGLNKTPWKDDKIAQMIVRECGPLNGVQIADLLEVHRSAVEQIERQAMAKIRDALAAGGSDMSAREWLEMLRDRECGSETVYPDHEV